MAAAGGVAPEDDDAIPAELEAAVRENYDLQWGGKVLRGLPHATHETEWHALPPGTRAAAGAAGWRQHMWEDTRRRHGRFAAGDYSTTTERDDTEAMLATVRAAQERLSAISVFHRKFILYGGFVWARGALNSRKRRFPARVGRSAWASRTLARSCTRRRPRGG